jgi:hypothetical protein
MAYFTKNQATKRCTICSKSDNYLAKTCTKRMICGFKEIKKMQMPF